MGAAKVYQTKEEQAEARRQRNNERYANDPEYRERVKANAKRYNNRKYEMETEEEKAARHEREHKRYIEKNGKEYARERLGCMSKEDRMAEYARLREADPETPLQARNQYAGKRREVIRKFHAGEITADECDNELDALRDAKNAHMREWYKTEAGRKYIRGNQLRKYGLTIEQFDAMYEAQNGCCAICGEPRSKRGTNGIVVDHCHDTGKVRALLCSQCNVMIGMARGNLAALEKAIQYLKGD